jgi:hypothetical protein
MAQMCWDIMKCGKERDCPAYPSMGFSCWSVEGTLCRGTRQGGYSDKIGDCRSSCQYYNGVMVGSIRTV